MKLNTRVLTGFMELTPAEQIQFDIMKNVISSTYESYGFTPIDTPVIERSEVVLAKAGGETEKQIYQFKKGERNLALRFDLTVPLARYVAEHFNDIPFPFKRSQVGKVFRGERAQRGRFREFYQCDIDVVGKDNLSLSYDSEMVRVIYDIFSKLNIGKFTVKINNRKILLGLIEEIGAIKFAQQVVRTIDKSEKISRDDFVAELLTIGLKEKQIEKVIDYMTIKGEPEHIIAKLHDLGIKNRNYINGLDEIQLVVEKIKAMNVPADYFMIDLSIARGLDYYTGTVYETVLDEHKSIGSICSGGRYDDLATLYTNHKLPGVGVSIGLTRLFSQLLELGLVEIEKQTVADVLIIPLNSEQEPAAIGLANDLRKNGVKTDVFMQEIGLKKRFSYADKLGIKNVVVIGEAEVDSGQYTLQNMTTGEKLSLAANKIIEKLVL